MICTHCNTPNPSGARFCTHCGSHLPAAAPRSRRSPSQYASLEIIRIYQNTDLAKGGLDAEEAAKRIASEVLHKPADWVEHPTESLRAANWSPSIDVMQDFGDPAYNSQPVERLSGSGQQAASLRAYSASHPYATTSQRLAAAPKRYPYRSSGSYAPRHAKSSHSAGMKILKTTAIVLGGAVVCVAVFLGGWYAAQMVYDATNKPVSLQTEEVGRSEYEQSAIASAPSSTEKEKTSSLNQTEDSQHAIKNSLSASASDSAALMVPKEEMYLHSSPDAKPETRTGVLPAGDKVRIVETVRNSDDPNLLFGKLESGEYVCLSNATDAFFETVSE